MNARKPSDRYRPADDALPVHAPIRAETVDSTAHTYRNTTDKKKNEKGANVMKRCAQNPREAFWEFHDLGEHCSRQRERAIIKKKRVAYS